MGALVKIASQSRRFEEVSIVTALVPKEGTLVSPASVQATVPKFRPDPGERYGCRAAEAATLGQVGAVALPTDTLELALILEAPGRREVLRN